MSFLPDDPKLSPTSPLALALRNTTEQLAAGAPTVLLPELTGLKPVLIVRWLYRHWLMTQESAGKGWRPLVHIDMNLAGSSLETLTESAHLAMGGWLFVEGNTSFAPPSGLTLLKTGGPRVAVPEAFATRLAWLDRFHLPATDPALAEIRRSLLSHCRSCSPVHLSGPPGSGKQTLAWWAHTTLDDRALSHIRRGGARRPVPGQWELYQEIGELDPDQLHHLRDRLHATQEPPLLPPSPEESAPRPRLPAFEPILGESASLARVLTQAARIAPTPLSVLITGESGCGKELMARSLHEASGRSGQYVPIDISSMNENLVESELFGHTSNAFTGAERQRMGAIRMADGGTLFLDELGNLSPRNQARLLRVLQERIVQPVGSDKSFPVNIRVVAATHADLEGMIARGEFREDLYRRINAVNLRLPPLRERGGDILLLAEILLKRALGVKRLPMDWLSDEARAALLSWRWPGNIRELGHVIEQAAVELLARGDGCLRVSDLGPLAPANRRPVPILTTSSDSPDKNQWGLERDLVQQLTAVTLRVPPLQDRSPRSIRAAILGLLEGRPIRADALSVLEKRPWWGNFPELHVAMAAIRSNLVGPVDLDGLRRILPHLVLKEGRSPIHILLNPVVQGDGSVTGLQEEYSEGGVLVGRLGSAREIDASHADPRSRARLEAIRSILGPIQPGCLNLPQLPYLSRAHCVVTRDEDGLLVHALPGVSLPVFAASMANGGARKLVTAGEPVSIGSAGELVVMNHNNSLYLQVFLFAGAIAREEFAHEAASRVGQDVGQGVTIQEQGQRARPLVVFEMETPEIELLTGVILKYSGGDFAAHLTDALDPLRHQDAGSRLCRYIVDSPRPTQYCTRLYEHTSNELARQQLARALGKLSDGLVRIERLPAGITRLLR